MSQHTDEPIFAEESNEGRMLWLESGIACIGIVYPGVLPDHTGEANARRIVALWNAAKGISTEDIEINGRGLLLMTKL